jgi:hypothetical protein
MISAYLILKRVRIQIVVKMSGEGVVVILASRRVLLKTHFLRLLRRLGVSQGKVTLRTLMAITPRASQGLTLQERTEEDAALLWRISGRLLPGGT